MCEDRKMSPGRAIRPTPVRKRSLLSVSLALCLVLGVNGTVSSSPSEVTEMSLREAYDLALEANHDIRSAAESVEQGRLLKKQALTVLYPNLTATAGYNRATYDGQEDIEGSTWGLNLTQTLYNGGKVWIAKRGADSTLRAAELGLEFAKQSVLMDLVSRSYDLLSAEDRLRVSEKRVERVREQLRQAQARLEVGDVPRTSVLAAQVALSTVQLEEVEAKKEVALARTRLANLTGSSLPVRVLLTPAITLPSPGSLAELTERALQNRPDLAQSRELVRIAGEEAELTRRGGHPNIDLTGSYTRYSEEDVFAPETQVGVNLTWPFFQGGLVRLQTREAYSRARQVEEGYGTQVDHVRLEVEEAQLTLETLQAQEELVGHNLDTAMENHRLALTRFELGAATSLEVLDAEEDLAEAEYLEVTHRYDTRTARAALLYSIGALELEAFGFPEATERPTP